MVLKRKNPKIVTTTSHSIEETARDVHKGTRAAFDANINKGEARGKKRKAIIFL